MCPDPIIQVPKLSDQRGHKRETLVKGLPVPKLAPSGPSLTEDWANFSSGMKETNMNRRTAENCVEILQKIIDVHQSQLGTGTVEEIEVVIAELKCQCGSKDSNEIPLEWAERILKVLGDVIRVISNINDFMN